IDPVADKKAIRAVAIMPTFEVCAKRVHEQRRKTWSNGKHVDQWINTLIDYVFPKIGTKPINQIVTADVLTVLEPIWNTKPETARRGRQRLYTVLDWARAAGRRLCTRRRTCGSSLMSRPYSCCSPTNDDLAAAAPSAAQRQSRVV